MVFKILGASPRTPMVNEKNALIFYLLFNLSCRNSLLQSYHRRCGHHWHLPQVSQCRSHERFPADVNDTSGIFAAGANDTSDKFIASVVDIGFALELEFSNNLWVLGTD
jgi:hypothetical protein